MRLTIFTPTYNRGYTLERLYNSLLNQTNNNFEWLVVNDGSRDDTDKLFDGILKEHSGSFEINYYSKENGGKHSAFDYALDKATGEIFFVVDSDDYLAEKAVERIFHYFDQIKDNSSFCGVCGQKAFFNLTPIGSVVNYSVLDTTIIDYRFNKRISGDKADVFRTELLKRNRLKNVYKEKWAPLSTVWNRFGNSLQVRYFNEIIYFAEYLPDGMSLNRLKLRKESPNNTMLYYQELTNYDIPFIEKIKASVNYWRFSFYSKTPLINKIKQIGFLYTMLGFFPGLIFHMIDLNDKLYRQILEPNKKIINQQSKK